MRNGVDFVVAETGLGIVGLVLTTGSVFVSGKDDICTHTVLPASRPTSEGRGGPRGPSTKMGDGNSPRPLFLGNARIWGCPSAICLSRMGTWIIPLCQELPTGQPWIPNFVGTQCGSTVRRLPRCLGMYPAISSSKALGGPFLGNSHFAFLASVLASWHKDGTHLRQRRVRVNRTYFHAHRSFYGTLSNARSPGIRRRPSQMLLRR